MLLNYCKPYLIKYYNHQKEKYINLLFSVSSSSEHRFSTTKEKKRKAHQLMTRSKYKQVISPLGGFVQEWEKLEQEINRQINAASAFYTCQLCRRKNWAKRQHSLYTDRDILWSSPVVKKLRVVTWRTKSWTQVAMLYVGSTLEKGWEVQLFKRDL